MKLPQVTGVVEALRREGVALRARPRHEIVESLAAVLDGWSHPTSAWRRALADELPAATGFSPQVVSEGLRIGLADWDGRALRAVVAAELGRFAGPDGREIVTGFDLTAVLLAGSIPMPTLLALLAPLVVGSPVVAKLASRDRVTAHHVARSVAEIDPALGRCIGLVEFAGGDEDCTDAMLQAGCVVATGSDATVAAVRARVAATTRLVVYGHRVSVAAVATRALAPAAAEEAARGLALDLALWDQLGCLSPVAVFVVDPDQRAAAAFAGRLAVALDAIAARLPRGEIDPAAAARFAQERAEAEMRAASDTGVVVSSGRDGTWTVVAEDSAAPRPTPLHRFIRIVPVRDSEEMLDALRPFERHLAAVGIAGFGADGKGLARRLAGRGASRICALGRMQAPPLSWHHDNQGLFVPIARLANLERPT